MNFLRDKRYSPKGWRDWYVIRCFVHKKAPVPAESIAMIVIGMLAIILPLAGWGGVWAFIVGGAQAAWFIAAGFLAVLGVVSLFM